MTGFPPPLRGFPLGLGGLFDDMDPWWCRVCGMRAKSYEKRPDGRTIWRHDGPDFCISPP